MFTNKEIHGSIDIEAMKQRLVDNNICYPSTECPFCYPGALCGPQSCTHCLSIHDRRPAREAAVNFIDCQGMKYIMVGDPVLVNVSNYSGCIIPQIHVDCVQYPIRPSYDFTKPANGKWLGDVELYKAKFNIKSQYVNRQAKKLADSIKFNLALDFRMFCSSSATVAMYSSFLEKKKFNWQEMRPWTVDDALNRCNFNNILTNNSYIRKQPELRTILHLFTGSCIINLSVVNYVNGVCAGESIAYVLHQVCKDEYDDDSVDVAFYSEYLHNSDWHVMSVMFGEGEIFISIAREETQHIF